MTYREAVAHGEKVLELSHIADAKTDAWLLLEMGCKIDRKFYYMHMEDDLPDDLLKEYELAIKKRAEHIPLQYIVGETEFMGLKFKVNSNVLIPRQDTETLVEEALKTVKPGMKVLDMCTGSGCIIISILHNVEGVKGYAVDISKQAVNVAKENAKLNEVPVLFERSDLFEMVTEKFDVIVSNPPYYVDSLLSPDEGRNTARHAAGLPFGELAAAVVRRTLCIGVAARRDAAIPFGGSRAALSRSLDGGLFYAPARGAAYPCGVLHDARTAAGTFAARDRTRRLGLLYGGLPPSDGGFLP